MSNQLRLQVVLEALDRASRPFQRINQQAQRMSQQINGSRSRVRQLESSLRGVQRTQQSMQATGRMANSAMANAENRLQAEIMETTRSIERQRDALIRLNQYARRMDGLSNRAGAITSAGRTMAQNVTLPTAVGLGATLKEASAVEKAMASVAKFAPQFKSAEKETAFLEKIKNSVADLSMQSGKAQIEIASMYEELGAANVAADKWESYSNKFINGAVALDMDAAELSKTALGIMASTGNKGNDAYLQKILEQANLASDMGNMRANNVLDVANRSMGLAKNAGIDESAFIGLTGAALDAGARDDVTGRAWKTLVARLTSTAKLTKTQNEAWKRLDIDPDVFTKAFKKDPIGQMEKLTDSAKKNADGMGELGIIIGTEFVDTVVKMGGNVETARKIQAALGDEQLRGMKFQAEYNRMQATTDANWKRSIQTIKHLAVTIGNQLLPKFNELLNSLKPIIKDTASWIKENPKLTKTILAIATALAVLGPVLFMIGKGMSAFILLARGIPMVIAGIRALTAVLIANPIGLAITGIATAAYLIYQNWGPISEFFKNLWGEVTQWFTQTWALLETDTVAGLAKIGQTILNWSPIGLFYKAFAAVMDYFNIEMPNSLTGFIAQTWERVKTSILSWSPLETFTQLFSSVINYFTVQMPASFTEMFTIIGGAVKNAILSWNPVGWFSSIFSGAFSWVESKLNGMVSFFSNLKTNISNFFSDSDSKMTQLSAKQKEYEKKFYANQQKKNSASVNQAITDYGNDKRAGKMSKYQKDAIMNTPMKMINKLPPEQRKAALDVRKAIERSNKQTSITKPKAAKKDFNQTINQNITVNGENPTATVAAIGKGAAKAAAAGARLGSNAMLSDTYGMA